MAVYIFFPSVAVSLDILASVAVSLDILASVAVSLDILASVAISLDILASVAISLDILASVAISLRLIRARAAGHAVNPSLEARVRPSRPHTVPQRASRNVAEITTENPPPVF